MTKVVTACNNRVGQFKPIFQVEGNTFHPIFFGYFIADWLLYKFAAGSFHTSKLCSRLYSTEIEFYSEKLKKNWFLSHPLGDLGVTYAHVNSSFFNSYTRNLQNTKSKYYLPIPWRPINSNLRGHVTVSVSCKIRDGASWIMCANNVQIPVHSSVWIESAFSYSSHNVTHLNHSQLKCAQCKPSV